MFPYVGKDSLIIAAQFPHLTILHFTSSFNWNRILQPPDHNQVIKHNYDKQFLSKTISVIDHKVLHDATFMQVKVLDTLNFNTES